VTPLGLPEPGPSPGGSPTASPRPTATAGASGGPSAAPAPRDPAAPIRFAVDLFDVAESNIAPGAPAALTALGGGGPAPDPGASGAPGTTAPPNRPPARDELWGPILLVVLVVLMVEWAVYQRDALTRLWRGLGARLRRPAGGGA
jgi:hypothetical protein